MVLHFLTKLTARLHDGGGGVEGTRTVESTVLFVELAQEMYVDCKNKMLQNVEKKMLNKTQNSTQKRATTL